MSKTGRKYTREFRPEAVRLLEANGRNAVQIERELGNGDGCLSQWRKKDGTEGAALTPGGEGGVGGREPVRQLGRENGILRQERDILKEAVAIFSRPGT